MSGNTTDQFADHSDNFRISSEAGKRRKRRERREPLKSVHSCLIRFMQTRAVSAYNSGCIPHNFSIIASFARLEESP